MDLPFASAQTCAVAQKPVLVSVSEVQRVVMSSTCVFSAKSTTAWKGRAEITPTNPDRNRK
jgi:hypothetical protein